MGNEYIFYNFNKREKQIFNINPEIQFPWPTEIHKNAINQDLIIKQTDCEILSHKLYVDLKETDSVVNEL
jgi:hypothetical protein